MVQKFIILIKLFNILSSWLASLTIHEKFENYVTAVLHNGLGWNIFWRSISISMQFRLKNALSEKLSTHCVQLSTCFIDQFLAGENLTAFMYVHNIWPG